MKKIRIGNDILIHWEIMTAEGEPYRLTDKSLQLILSTTYDRKEVSKFEVEDNILMFTYMGKNQRQLGRYTVTLIENNGKEGMHTVDACDAFELVARSCEAGGDADGNVEAITLELNSVITVGGGGGGNIDPELLEGFIPLSRDFSDDFNNDFAR